MKHVSNPFSPNALDLLKKRYLPDGETDIQAWIERVVMRIAQKSEQKDLVVLKQYKNLLLRRAFLPTSSALKNSFNDEALLAGCLVLPLTPETENIYSDSLPKIGKMQLMGTGVGLDLSVLPPRLHVSAKNGSTYPGPIEILLGIASSVDGPTRYAGVKRAAFMATLFVQHPDIFEFISLKTRENIPNVNMSVSVDQIFISGLKQSALLPLGWEVEGERHFLTLAHLAKMKEQADKRGVRAPDLSIVMSTLLFSKAANGIVGRVIDDVLCVDSQILLTFIAKNAHACGDPGIVNLQAINESNPTHPRYSPESKRAGVGAISTTTPCGEQPLLPYEVCHLGSFNLLAFTSSSSFDFASFELAIKVAVRFMDDLVESSKSGIKEIDQMMLLNRKIGLGIMGLADTLAELEIAYDSKEALLLVEQIGRLLKITAESESIELAKAKGEFLNFKYSKYKDGPKRRHATLTTIAPTGHIATLADCSTGIEPYFLLAYKRDAAGIKLEKCGVLEQKLQKIDFSLERWIEETKKQKKYHFDGTLAGLCDNRSFDPEKNSYLAKLKGVFKTAHEISPLAHLEMTAALQKYIDNGISKTINLNHHASIADVEQIILSAFKMNLKGITIFRDGCLKTQALTPLMNCSECEELSLDSGKAEGQL